MAVERTRTNVTCTCGLVLLLSVSFLLQGCGPQQSAAFNSACEDWCEADQWKEENGQLHRDWHCNGDMTDMCGGCPYCGGSAPSGACENWCEDDQWTEENGQLHRDWHCNGDMTDMCGGCPYCGGSVPAPSPTVPNPSNGPGPSPEDDSSGSCCDRLGVHSQENGACIAVRDHKVMMISAHPYSTWKPDYSWDLPGGTNHAHESGNLPQECTCEAAERETLEEANIKVKAVKTTRNGGIFICEYLNDDNSLKSPETIDQQKWYTWEEFQGLTLRYAWDSNYKDIVEDALK